MVRVGIDGPVERDTAALADAVAAALVDAGLPVVRPRATDFLRARSLRLEFGRDDPDAFHDLWYDFPALRREVLEPLGPGGSGNWLPRLRDAATDRPWRDPPRVAAPGTVLVLDGRFLLRDDIRDALDVVVHLDMSAAARARRLPEVERRRVLGAWERYLAECDPASRADFLVRYDHPARPALVRHGRLA